ncbi:MAG TPA: FAD-dependent oxidoreductase, partial [Thermoanaerobaculia bacterium]|nr:FAD-dependent oxidoreductase [Thermoanaerobaculia bacterium]
MEEKSFREVDVFDVFIIGAGLAGLTLARQLLLARPEIRILMVDRQAEIPSPKQKVGEATVQVSGYYYSRVLEMEEHLLREHFLKYNLRFYWKSQRGGDVWEDLSQSYIRKISNIGTFQLDRNKFEAALLEKNRESPNFELIHPTTGLQTDLAEDGPHGFRFEAEGREISGRATWMVDASGRNRFLVRRQQLDRPSPIAHGSSFLWVEGLLDPEKCTRLDRKAIRLRPERSALGHFPTFLATNHYCGEGYWFWEIPLHGKTSLGLVFDSANVAFKDVSTPEKLVEW